MQLRTTLTAFLAVFTLTACQDRQAPTQAILEGEPAAAAMIPQQAHWTVVGRVAGLNVQDITLPLADGETFTGRVVNLRLTEGAEPGEVLASGRVIGQVNGRLINEVFTDLPLQVFGADGISPPTPPSPGVCPILFLELGPIFLDVLGLIVEVPEPIVVEVRAERGPGQLLGNLLCALLGILD